ncbi:MAG: sulfurtransferase-like selenium metabolism protein YedF [Chitinispirillaceae bacterium]|nr:sulfurtransferase-like selenium metabolism protein YedF [Chitinispirillaceae bacterium]
MKTVDARGQACPKPIILTKQALKEIAPGEEISVLIDNPTSRQNVERFLADNGMTPRCSENGGVFTIVVGKPAEPLSHPDAASYCSSSPRPHIIVFSSDKMGSGSEELGEILMKAFVNTIRDVSPLPSHLVFYNSGIFLTIEGSSVVESLKHLESLGISLLVCGTCAEYFGKKDAVRVGTVSNMYTILETMTAAGHIVQP